MSNTITAEQVLEPVKIQKKITRPSLIKMISDLSESWHISHAEVCYRILTDNIPKEHKKIGERQ